MNIPSADKLLKFTTASGDPIVVSVSHKGKKYLLRISQTILAVWDSGAVDPATGLPAFNVQAAPVMAVSEDKSS